MARRPDDVSFSVLRDNVGFPFLDSAPQNLDVTHRPLFRIPSRQLQLALHRAKFRFSPCSQGFHLGTNDSKVGHLTANLFKIGLWLGIEPISLAIAKVPVYFFDSRLKGMLLGIQLVHLALRLSNIAYN